ncbi:MAG: agmatine deiminase family protein [Bacteroidales bacterium]
MKTTYFYGVLFVISYFLMSYSHAQTGNVPDGQKAKMTENDPKIVESEISCIGYYYPGNTYDMMFTYNHSSPDYEWTDGIFLDFPIGVTVNSASNIIGEQDTLFWNGETGEAALVTWGDTTGGSELGPVNDDVTFTVNITVDTDITGDLDIYWSIIGDEYGAPPHTNSDTITLVEGVANDLASTGITINYTDYYAHVGVPLTPRVSYTNCGMETQNSFVVGLIDNNGYHEEITINQSIAPGENQSVYFPCWAPDSAGNTTLTAYINSEEDENTENDTITQNLIVFDLQIHNAPPENPRSIAEFEPNEGVIVQANNIGNFQVPDLLLFILAQETTLYVVCDDQGVADIVTNNFINYGINVNNVEFIFYHADTYWTRDYGPWFIEYNDNSVGITNFGYNRDVFYDNAAPLAIADFFDIESFDMPIVHTGGNYMTDGYGTTASCDVLYYENNCLTENQVHDSLYHYLGLTNYHILSDPLNSYLQHIDCWGKFLAPDKIMILEVPSDNSNYQDLENMAEYWTNQTSPYGNKYQVHRVFTPNGQPYTNSLIVNDKVLVPMNPNFGNDCYLDALDSYQQAMPGYEIIGVPYESWWSMDALHCRTNEVPELEMLRIVHYPYLDTIPYQDTFTFEADIYSLSATENMGESAKLFYKINHGEYQQVTMTNDGDTNFSVDISEFIQGDSVCYYIQAENNNNKTEKHPYIGEYDPHCFYINQSSSVSKKVRSPSMVLHPNPARNEIFITIHDLAADTYNLQFVDIHGKTVLETGINVKSNKDKFYFNISALKSGLYLLKISGNQCIMTKKFIKHL